MTKALAIEYASRGIRANAVALGVIRTPMHPVATYEATGRTCTRSVGWETSTTSLTRSCTSRTPSSLPARSSTSTAARAQATDHWPPPPPPPPPPPSGPSTEPIEDEEILPQCPRSVESRCRCATPAAAGGVVFHRGRRLPRATPVTALDAKASRTITRRSPSAWLACVSNSNQVARRGSSCSATSVWRLLFADRPTLEVYLSVLLHRTPRTAACTSATIRFPASNEYSCGTSSGDVVEFFRARLRVAAKLAELHARR